MATGKVRANKREVYVDFFNKKILNLYETKLGFIKLMTICGYLARSTKIVLLLFTEHHDKKITPQEQNKSNKNFIDKKFPEIDIHYNSNKGRIERVDHLFLLYTCRRKTNRWAMNILFYILEIAS